MQQGVTLTIEPGVEVRFDGDKGMVVEGQLIATGNDALPIVFTSNALAPASGDWKFLRFTDTSVDATFDATGDYLSGSVLGHCEVRFGGGPGVLGTLQFESASPFVDSCTIENNAATGIHASDPADLRISSSTIHYNESGFGRFVGGGVTIVGGMVSITNSTISQNSLSRYSYGAAGVLVDRGTVRIINNMITGNTMEPNTLGTGGIWVEEGAGIVSQNTIDDNEGYWGGMYVQSYEPPVLTVAGNVISNNRSNRVGGIEAVGSAGMLTIRNNAIINNAGGSAGGLNARGGPAITGNEIGCNTSARGQAVILGEGSGGVLSQNTIARNLVETPDRSSAIDINGNRWTINQNNVFDNNTTYALFYAAPVGTVDAENNWWGTASTADIEAAIFHFVDDATLGLVDFEPFLGAPNPNAPAAACVPSVPTPQPDLTVSKSASPDPATTADQVTYTISVSNIGAATADGVTFADRLPASVDFVSSSIGVSQSGDLITGDLGALNPGASANFTITVQPNQPGTICNTVQVSASQPESDSNNNSVTICSSVTGAIGEADLTITKTVAPDPVQTGQNLVYTIMVVNNGPDTATGVTVTDVLPPGVNFISASPSQGSCTGTAVIACDLGTLPVAASATITVVVQP